MTSQPQNMRALQIANDVRLANAAVCRRIASLPRPSALEEVARLLTTDESDTFGRLRIERLLRSIPRFGVSSARSALTRVGVVRVDKRVGELTPRQRVALADVLVERSAWSLSRDEAA